MFLLPQSSEGGAGLKGRRTCAALSARKGINLGTFSWAFGPGCHISGFQPAGGVAGCSIRAVTKHCPPSWDAEIRGFSGIIFR
jgi:hypothetical protein